ncbi:MAG: BadF/BadG/BcrA/BcrD ATPase family protein [Candidatus Marinimicrobia bacterium]|nr:BadF/BadG/BcrA/BcrD ATPase family protein [Candidatus Neomarinimicrobiota bacterium]
MANERWILSIDGGGSKTDLLLLDTIARRGFIVTGNGTNPNVYGQNGIRDLENLIGQVLSRASCDAADVEACVVGMAGISNRKYKPALETMLETTFAASDVNLTSDAELAHHSIWRGNPGITLIAGTGSIVIGIDSEGRLHRAGGVGFTAGDEGSGYWLGKSILTQLITNERSSDEDVVELKEAVSEFFGKTEFEEVLQSVSLLRGTVSSVAAVAPIVLSIAESENFLASQVVSHGAEKLAEMVEEVSEKMGLKAESLSLGCCGSLIKQSLFYRDQVEEFLLLSYADVEWVTDDHLPVFGGLALMDTDIDEWSQLDIEHV